MPETNYRFNLKMTTARILNAAEIVGLQEQVYTLCIEQLDFSDAIVDVKLELESFWGKA